MTSSDNLYSQYIKERYDWETIFLEQKGFATYSIEDDTLKIIDIFLVKEHRDYKTSRALIKKLYEVAYKHKCAYAITGVHLDAPAAAKNMMHIIFNGFEPYKNSGQMVWFKRKVIKE